MKNFLKILSENRLLIIIILLFLVTVVVSKKSKERSENQDKFITETCNYYIRTKYLGNYKGEYKKEDIEGHIKTIKKNWRKFTMKWHPDRPTGNIDIFTEGENENNYINNRLEGLLSSRLEYYKKKCDERRKINEKFKNKKGYRFFKNLTGQETVKEINQMKKDLKKNAGAYKLPNEKTMDVLNEITYEADKLIEEKYTRENGPPSFSPPPPPPPPPSPPPTPSSTGQKRSDTGRKPKSAPSPPNSSSPPSPSPSPSPSFFDSFFDSFFNFFGFTGPSPSPSPPPPPPRQPKSYIPFYEDRPPPPPPPYSSEPLYKRQLRTDVDERRKRRAANRPENRQPNETEAQYFFRKLSFK